MIDWAALTPILIILGSAVLAVIFEAFIPRQARRGVQVVLSMIAIAAAVVSVVWRWTVVSADGPTSIAMAPDGSTDVGTFVEDGAALAFQLIILVCALVALLVIADRTQTGEGAFVASAATQPGSSDEREATTANLQQTEVFPLMLFSLGGMLTFASAGDLLTLFIALEVLSLPLYVLTATARRRRALSQEAAMKYFVLGAFSSGFFLMGSALLYGYSGALTFRGIGTKIATGTGMDMLLIAGVTMVLVGLLFKVGAAPFHAWTPDTYQGAPTPVTGYMAAGTKIAAFAAMLRFLYVIGSGVQWEITPVLWTVIIVTMAIGTVMGLIQTDIKRMLAYSSIAHAGFILIGVASFSQQGISATAFYLLAYGIASVGAFGIVTLVRETDTEGNILGEATTLEKWQGLGKTNPLLATSMAIFLLSFAGIPLTSGFIGKFAAFSAGVANGGTVLVVLAVLASAATAFFYFRLISYMFFRDPVEGSQTVASEGFSIVAIIACAILTVALGVFPQPILDFLGEAAVFML
ncbi:MAG: NADH-quinone oxidoreductase subunit NuoN [Ancrocorticia sp.]|uniref:NADH-quinone oxidoreductase subunit NuoN n=1 Tax=Ancrocorticia sp. TaxID=2593684 RepID=UPI003F8F26DF